MRGLGPRGVVYARRGVPPGAGALMIVWLFTSALGTTAIPHRPVAAAAPPPAAAAPPVTAVAPPVAPPSLAAPLALTIPSAGPLLTPAITLPVDLGLQLITPGCSDVGGLDSPYLGYDGTFDGAGDDITGAVRTSQLSTEQAMGLTATFIPVYWSKFEPNGPTDASNDTAGTWAELDAAVILAHSDGLTPWINVVVGGSAGGPPSWAGERVTGSSAPQNMDALVNFVVKLQHRYMPGGSLATAQKWGQCYGVRAWELDSEPSTDRGTGKGTTWAGEAGDYAEFVVKAAIALHAFDPLALALAPAIADGAARPSGTATTSWVDDVLAASHNGDYSAAYAAAGRQYVPGPFIDAVSFHSSELLDCASPQNSHCMVTDAHDDIAKVFDNPAYMSQPGSSYAAKTRWWCTACDYDVGVMDPAVGFRADWVVQWMARAFADGITKLTAMNCSDSTAEQAAVATWVSLFHNVPFPFRDVTAQLGYDPTQVSIFRWTSPVDGHWIYVAWAANNGNGTTTVALPVRFDTPFLVDLTNTRSLAHPSGGKVTLTLSQGAPFSAPTFLVDGLPGAP